MTREVSSPNYIKKIASAAFPALAMLAGVDLGVFAALKNKPMDIQDIATTLSVGQDKLESLLYALVTAELLKLKDNLFSNTREANQFLIPNTSSYIGTHPFLNPLVMWWDHYGALKTADTIRTGTSALKYDFAAKSEEELRQDFQHTQPIAIRAGRELVTKFDFSSYQTLVDVGGGPGGLSIAITELCSNIKATVIDIASVTPVTRWFVEQAGTSDRIQVVTADAVTESLTGQYDVAVLRAFIQVLSPIDVFHSLKNVYSIIKPGGMLYILGHILDDTRISPLEEVWHKLSSINYYDVPSPYTEEEHREWLLKAGFEHIERSFLPNDDGVIRAQKPL
ncbi:MAG: methyltransferase [Candidatus Heimdallarchaeota archaeon]|nr:methyltransferase [Candidatus Heimdallarchaeota archaeon]MCK4954818.1 methyltransferase [Candidatus Heimdallarchaeota archaeon]